MQMNKLNQPNRRHCHPSLHSSPVILSEAKDLSTVGADLSQLTADLSASMGQIMIFTNQNRSCHPERSEGSLDRRGRFIAAHRRFIGQYGHDYFINTHK